MFYTDKDLNEFVRFTCQNYDAFDQDVYKMVGEEMDTLIRESSARRTAKHEHEKQVYALANCRAWLAEDRKQLTAIDIVSYRPAKNYFNSITKR